MKHFKKILENRREGFKQCSTVKPVMRGHMLGDLNGILCEPSCTFNIKMYLQQRALCNVGRSFKCPLLNRFYIFFYNFYNNQFQLNCTRNKAYFAYPF